MHEDGDVDGDGGRPGARRRGAACATRRANVVEVPAGPTRRDATPKTRALRKRTARLAWKLQGEAHVERETLEGKESDFGGDGNETDHVDASLEHGDTHNQRHCRWNDGPGSATACHVMIGWVMQQLWHAYLQERSQALRGCAPHHPGYEAMNSTYERALVNLHKMPRIWMEYLQFLVTQKRITKARHAFDRALCALPITQHNRIWEMYLEFAKMEGVPAETSVRIYRRYLKLEPTHVEEFVGHLLRVERWGEAASLMADALSDPGFRSSEGKSRHQLWFELCDVITKHPDDVRNLNVEGIIRSGMVIFRDEVGRLWASLADYYIRKGMFERARSIYEEAMEKVSTVHDFSLVFDAYSHFEESIVTARIEMVEEEGDQEVDEDGREFWLKDTSNDLDLRLARLEDLMNRRPVMLSSVLLRQNPHNVHEWHKRVRLFEGDPVKQIETYGEAVRTVDPKKAVGRPHSLWCAFAKFYERHADIDNARMVFKKGTDADFKTTDDLASVWCEWAEMELRQKNYQGALDLMKKATSNGSSGQIVSRSFVPQQHLHKSLKLWSFYCDLEESLGTLEGAREVYEKMLDIKVATPQIILNYALLLQEHRYFEDSFRVYERGINLFNFPHVKDIWQAYLAQFVDRFKGSKLERARDLFEQVLDVVPPDDACVFFLQYAKFEEDYGLTRHAMEIYERAAQRVPVKEKRKVYTIYIHSAMEYFGVARTRHAYEHCINADLLEDDARAFCLDYSRFEQKIGEIDRARAILIHGSQFADPRRHPEYWKQWKQFEIDYGNEDTFREMLRIKRSVAAAFAQQYYNFTAASAVEKSEANETAMAALEKAQGEGTDGITGFVPATAADEGGKLEQNNPDEIDLGEDEDEEDAHQEKEDVHLQEQPVPRAVYGSLQGREP